MTDDAAVAAAAAVADADVKYMLLHVLKYAG